MICQSTYDSFDAIPEALRTEFEQVGGKWQLKRDAIPGVAELFNAALAANSERQLQQLADKKHRVKELEREVEKLKDESSVLKAPGARVLSADDSKHFDQYIQLGSVKDLQSAMQEIQSLRDRVAADDRAKEIHLIVSDTSLNADVLASWAASPEGSKLKFFMKDVESTNEKGEKTTVKVPMVSEEVEEGGKIKSKDFDLLQYAKSKMPGWMFSALTAEVDQAKSQTPSPSERSSVRMPNLGPARRPDDKAGNERPVDKFNKARESRPSPFAPKSNKAVTT